MQKVNKNSKTDYLSVSDVAKKLGISIDTVRRWEKAGVLQAERLDGRNRYFKASDIDTFAAEQPMSTSEVADFLGLSASTVRRLDKQGLLFTERSESGKRLYSRDSVQALKDDKADMASRAAQPAASVPAVAAEVPATKVAVEPLESVVELTEDFVPIAEPNA
jgi:excisionase family DNA binding protein